MILPASHLLQLPIHSCLPLHRFPYLCFAGILDDTLDFIDERQLVNGDEAHVGFLLAGVEKDDHLDVTLLVW